jgi:DNA polymerase IIIc chi subunit
VLQSIKLYQTNKENLFRSACLLLSKCFKERLKVLVITKSHQDSVLLDNSLWTFSRQLFIPHALSSDNILDDHPIIIGNDLDDGNLRHVVFDVVVFIERFDIELTEFKKVALMFTEQDKSQAIKLQQKIACQVADLDSNYYTQSSSGEWTKAKL